MAAPAAAAAPVYIGGVAVIYGFMYATNPEFRRAHNSLGEAMGQGLSDGYDTVEDLIFGSDDAQTSAPPTTAADAATDTATDTARCPVIPYIHYTDPASSAAILASRIILPGLGGGVYLAQDSYGPVTVWVVIFIMNPLYAHKSSAWVTLAADCTAPISLREPKFILSEFFHIGPLRDRPPNVTILLAGPNIFPEHPNFDGISLP